MPVFTGKRKKLSDLISSDAVVLDLEATDRDGAIEALMRRLIAAGRVPAEAEATVVRSILERERKGSTGFGKGVAVPHAKHPSVPEIAGAVGLSRSGLDFHSLDGKPVHQIVLLVSPSNRSQDHIDAMQSVFVALHSDPFRRSLREAKSTQDVLDLLHRTDAAAR